MSKCILCLLLFVAAGFVRGEGPENKTPSPEPKVAGEKTKEKPVPKAAEVAEKPKVAAKDDEKDAGFYRVVPGAFLQKLKVSGTVESTRGTPVEMDLKRWTDMTVSRAVAHGTSVKAGDPLIELDTKALKKKVADLKTEVPVKELDFAMAERELENAEKTTPLSLQKSRREKMQAEQDLAYFEDEGRPMRERGAREEVKEIGNALAYAEEELKQLRKMYEQDDLTEETEEIILQRAENTVSKYRWMLEQTTARTARLLDTTLSREHENLKANLETQSVEWRSGEKASRDALEKKRLELAAKGRELEELRLSLAEHEEDLASMKVVAPHDGIVYYGASQRAKWTTAATVERKLIPGGKLAMREVVMTVVDPKKPRIRLSVAEEKLTDLAEGQTGEAHLKWKPDFKFSASVDSVLPVPYPDKTFDAVLELVVPAGAPVILPGMTAEAEIVVYETGDAIAVPKGAVKKEGEKEFVVMEDGRRVEVLTGRSDGDRIEILEGLKRGDLVRTAAEKKAPEKGAGEEKSEAGGEEKPGSKDEK